MIEGGGAILSAGVVIGVIAAQTVEAVIEAMVMPLISTAFGSTRISELHWVTSQGSTPGPYQSIAQAHESGAIVVAYGRVLTSLLSLFAVALVLFLSAKILNRVRPRISVLHEKDADS